MDYISKRNLFETKQRTRSLEFIRVFFFFLDVTTGEHSTWQMFPFPRETYPCLNLTSCRWYLESEIFLNPQKYSFFFFLPDENPGFFFPSSAEIFIKQFICDGYCRPNGIGIVFQFIRLFLSLIFLSLIRLLVVKKKGKRTDTFGVIFEEFYLLIF